MNKWLHLLHSALVLMIVAAVFLAGTSARQLYQARFINNIIANTERLNGEDFPKQVNVQFAQAFYKNKQGRQRYALDLLTQVITTGDKKLKALAHFNRANINLRRAEALQMKDPKKIPLIELAKQDYRTALFLMPELWDARYNLELALNISPELPIEDGLFEKQNVGSRKVIESVGFKVDLP